MRSIAVLALVANIAGCAGMDPERRRPGTALGAVVGLTVSSIGVYTMAAECASDCEDTTAGTVLLGAGLAILALTALLGTADTPSR